MCALIKRHSYRLYLACLDSAVSVFPRCKAALRATSTKRRESVLDGMQVDESVRLAASRVFF